MARHDRVHKKKHTKRQSHVLLKRGARVGHRHCHCSQRLAGDFSPTPHITDLDHTESSAAYSLIDPTEMKRRKSTKY